MKTYTNRGKRPSCLIYDMDEKDTITMWAIEPVEKNDVIKSIRAKTFENYKNEDNTYIPIYNFIVIEILDRRDFKATWPSLSKEERIKRNTNSFYKLKVEPVS